MEAIKQEQRRSLVRDFLLLNPDSSCVDVVKHFVKQGMNRRTVYRYVKRLKEDGDTKSRYSPGHKPHVLTTKIKKKLFKLFDGKVGATVANASRKLRIGEKVIKRWLKELGIKRKSRKVIPCSTEKQKKKQQVILHKIARQEFRASNDDTQVIMDDETYFPLSGNNFDGNNYYYDSGLQTLSEDIKYRGKMKFEPKILLWMAISSKGHSTPIFRYQNEGAINGQVYRDQCIIKGLIPFIKKYHSESNYLFWPDLASSHYAKPVLELLRNKNVNFLDKTRNPPNMPQIRPIETFWSHLKSKVYAEGYKAKNLKELEKRIRKMIRTFEAEHFERLMSTVGKKVRNADTRGPLGERS